MANPYYNRPGDVTSGTTIRADKYNSDLDEAASAFDAVDQKLQNALFLPSTFTGDPTIPEQTVTNTFIYINGAGDLGLYPIQTFLDQFAQVTAQYNQIDSWRQQVSSNAISAQESANNAQNFATADKDTLVNGSFYSAKHYSLIALDHANAASVTLSSAQASAATATNKAQEADDFANYAHNQVIPSSGGKYSAYHWSKEAESYAQQTLETVEGDFVPNSRTVNSKALSANIILTASDINAVPISSTVNGQNLSASITLTASDVGALPASTTLATLGGVPTTRTVNGIELSSDITLTASDVSALPASTTLASLGGVPTSRQVNGNALTGDITLTASDVSALPDTHRATSITHISSSFTATKNAELTRYAYTGEADVTVTVDSNSFSNGDTLLINKSRKVGEMTLTSGANMVTPDGTAETSHYIPTGYDCTIELLFGASGVAQLRVY